MAAIAASDGSDAMFVRELDGQPHPKVADKLTQRATAIYNAYRAPLIEQLRLSVGIISTLRRRSA